MDEALERFLRYVKIDTQSNGESPTSPSAAKELNLLKLLQQELKDSGIESELSEFGVLYGKLSGEPGLDPIGLNAHVDTASELSGANVKPQLIVGYDGGTIKLNDAYSMSPAEFPSLQSHLGDDLVVTSGDTLLGADDKAGVAIIMTTLAFYASHPEIKHHPICFAFTPDEEIGRGPEHFDVQRFGAKYAYTIDGGNCREIAVATFNAAHAKVIIHGVAIHPGAAKGRMVNSQTLAFAFDAMLPKEKRPEFTEGEEGFNHLVKISGSVDETQMHYILRNHDRAKLEEQKKEFLAARDTLQKQYPDARIEVEIQDDYRNMNEVFKEHPEAVNHAVSVYRRLGIEPIFPPVRGGTDGATFSFMGCPTPNLGTGGYNCHGRYEYLSIGEFHRMIEIVEAILKA